MLLAFIPLSLALSYYGHVYRQQQQALDAWLRMTNKGVECHCRSDELDETWFFIKANVTDADLDAFPPAFNGYLPWGSARIVKIRLNGSPVSAEAVERFRQAVPACEIEP